MTELIQQPAARRSALPAAAAANARARPGRAAPVSHGETVRRLGGRFGQDFSGVRVHDGAAARAMAAERGALAFTYGEDIVLGAGVQSLPPPLLPGLLAHELTHVAQQRGGGRSEHHQGAPMLEPEADAAAQTYMHGGAPRISGRHDRAIAMLTVEEGERKLWGYVPGWAKDYVRPTALQAKHVIESVVDPKTELPKPVEQVIEAAAVVAPAPPPAPAPAAPAPQAKAPPAPKPSWKAAVVKAKADLLGKVRDSTMESLGEAKGVALEVGNLVDTVLWVPYTAHQLTESALTQGTAALGLSDEQKKMVMDEFKALTPGYDTGMAFAAKHGLVSETGAPAVSGAIAGNFDKGADFVEKGLFSGATPEDPLVFSSYEMGELEGAVGSQVLLAFVGVEEVQVALKIVGALGAIKNFVESVIRAGSGWYKNVDVIVGAFNIGLSVLGLRQARAARRIIDMVIAAGGLVNAVPTMTHLLNDWNDPELAKDPARREKVLKADYAAVIKAFAAIIQGVIQHGMAKKAAGRAAAGTVPATPAAETPAPAASAKPIAPPAAAKPAVAPPVSVEPPAAARPAVAPAVSVEPPAAAKPAVVPAVSVEPPAAAKPAVVPAAAPVPEPVAAKPAGPPVPITLLEPPGGMVNKLTGAAPAGAHAPTPAGEIDSSHPLAKRLTSATAANDNATPPAGVDPAGLEDVPNLGGHAANDNLEPKAPTPISAARPKPLELQDEWRMAAGAEMQRGPAAAGPSAEPGAGQQTVASVGQPPPAGPASPQAEPQVPASASAPLTPGATQSTTTRPAGGPGGGPSGIKEPPTASRPTPAHPPEPQQPGPAPGPVVQADVPSAAQKPPRLKPGEPYSKEKRRPSSKAFRDVPPHGIRRDGQGDPTATVLISRHQVRSELQAEHARLSAAMQTATPVERRRAGYQYESLLRRDLLGGEESLRVSHQGGDVGRHGDIGIQEATVERRLSTAKLDQLWRDLGERGYVILNVPKLSNNDAAQLAHMAAVFQKVTGRRPSVFVRETAP